MIRRITTLLGLIELGILLCVVAALTSGCATIMPPSAKEFRQASGKAIQIAEAALTEAQAVRQETIELRTTMAENTQTINKNFEEVGKRLNGLGQEIQQASGKTNLLVRDIRKTNSGISSLRKDAKEARAEAVMAHKGLGEKIDASTATTGTAVADVGRKVDVAAAEAVTAHTALDRKVDRRADQVIGEVAGVNAKVDETKVAAGKAAAEANMAKVEAQLAGGKAEAAGTKAETAAAKSTADVTVEVSKARTELASHVVEAELARQDILRALGTLSPPAPGASGGRPSP